MDQNAKSKFLKIFANIPINVRNEIISVVDGKTISWNVAFLEINKETEIGEKILINMQLVGLLDSD